MIKIVSVPRFRDTGSLVLLDLKTLETFELKLLGHEKIKIEIPLVEQDVVMIESSSAAASPICD